MQKHMVIMRLSVIQIKCVRCPRKRGNHRLRHRYDHIQAGRYLEFRNVGLKRDRFGRRRTIINTSPSETEIPPGNVPIVHVFACIRTLCARFYLSGTDLLPMLRHTSNGSNWTTQNL